MFSDIAATAIIGAENEQEAINALAAHGQLL
jgi:hypothetical protein